MPAATRLSNPIWLLALAPLVAALTASEFAALDVDGDGALSLEELRDYELSRGARASWLAWALYRLYRLVFSLLVLVVLLLVGAWVYREALLHAALPLVTHFSELSCLQQHY